jgi:hypothetical protein
MLDIEIVPMITAHNSLLIAGSILAESHMPNRLVQKAITFKSYLYLKMSQNIFLIFLVF